MRICNSVLILIFDFLACVGGIPRLGDFLPRGVVFACFIRESIRPP